MTLGEMDFARSEKIAAAPADMIARLREASAMRSYRIYKLNLAGRIVTGTDALCASDEAAMIYAASIFGPHARAEIWLRDRRVGELGGVAGTPQASAPAPGARDRDGTHSATF